MATVTDDEDLELAKTELLAAKYQETVGKYSPQIKECLRIAEASLRDAERIAEEHGIPFYSRVSRLRQTYTPAKLPELDIEVLQDITGAYPDSEYGSGWQHSQVC